jgi:tetratricopeptide (TPR) repeat protein
MSANVFRFCLALATGFVANAADLDREMILVPLNGVGAEDREIARWQERLAGTNARVEEFERLAWAFVAKARRTQDPAYFKLAEKTSDVLERAFGASPESRLIRGHAWHNLHKFVAAEELARQLVEERGSALDLALLSDVLLERGKLTEATDVLQRLVDVRPGPESYSRIAQLRWLKGDVEGAFAANREAFKATGLREAETQAWLLVRLSALHLQSGRAVAAQRLAADALERLEAYPPALLARGRAALARNQVAAAVRDFREAEKLQPAVETRWWLAEALEVENGGRPTAESDALLERIRERGESTDARALALFLATRGEALQRALRLARAELQERSDVFSHDAVAWAALAAGDLALASEHARAALAEGTRDARLLWHGGEIAWRNGDLEEARRRIAEARMLAATLLPSERARLEKSWAAISGGSE